MEKQKKRKKHIFLKIFLILTLVFVIFIAVGNFLYDEYGEYDYFDEYYEDDYSDDGYYGYEDYDIEVPENTNLKASDYELL